MARPDSGGAEGPSTARRAGAREGGAPLTHLKTGARATVVSLANASEHDRNKLMALGVMPGAVLLVQQRFPSWVVALGYTQIALDKETARLIHVRALE